MARYIEAVKAAEVISEKLNISLVTWLISLRKSLQQTLWKSKGRNYNL
jgi:hypothetical protein